MSEATPTLRFPGFDQPWKPAHAGDAFRSSRARGRDGLPIYSVTLDRGLVPRASLDRHLAADAADEQNLRAQPGDLVYNTMRMWQGAVGRAEVECMVSPAYVVLTPKKGVSSAFFDYWFQHPRMRHLLGAYSHGLTSDRLRLYPDDFAQIPISLPDPAEQERIASAIEAVDRKIALLREEQQAFAHLRDDFFARILRREISMRRDDGTLFRPWGRCRLGTGIALISGQHLAPHEYDAEIAGIPYFTGPSDYTNTSSAVSKWTTLGRAKEAISGDVLITVKGSGVGEVFRLRLDRVAMGRQLMAIRSRDILAELIFYYLSRPEMRHAMEARASGNMIPGLSREDISSLEVYLPTEKEEQSRICSVLRSFDTRIEGSETIANGMEEFRRGLIQRLFPDG